MPDNKTQLEKFHIQEIVIDMDELQKDHVQSDVDEQDFIDADLIYPIEDIPEDLL